MIVLVDEDIIRREGLQRVEQSTGMNDPDLPFSGQVRVSVVLLKSDDEIIIEGSAEGIIPQDCGHCLERFTQRLRVPVSMRQAFDWKTNDRVDITGELRESFLLAVPLNPICGDDCRGLCPRCGVNRNRTSCSCASEHIPSRGFEQLADLSKKLEVKGD